MPSSWLAMKAIQMQNTNFMSDNNVKFIFQWVNMGCLKMIVQPNKCWCNNVILKYIKKNCVISIIIMISKI